jgi:hypothetical protein
MWYRRYDESSAAYLQELRGRLTDEPRDDSFAFGRAVCIFDREYHAAAGSGSAQKSHCVSSVLYQQHSSDMERVWGEGEGHEARTG